MLAAIQVPSTQALPQSPLLVHPEPEDVPYYVQPNTPVPAPHPGPLPYSLPVEVPEAPTVMRTRKPITFQGEGDAPFYKSAAFWIGIGVVGAAGYLFLIRGRRR